MPLILKVGPGATFVDVSAYVALAFESDDEHANAVAIAQRLQSQKREMFTITVMLAEAHARLVQYAGRYRASEFLARIYRSTSTTILPVSESDEREAVKLILQYEDKDFSFADALAFTVMERVGITSAFSFDRHFEQYGKFSVFRRPDLVY